MLNSAFSFFQRNWVRESACVLRYILLYWIRRISHIIVATAQLRRSFDLSPTRPASSSTSVSRPATGPARGLPPPPRSTEYHTPTPTPQLGLRGHWFPIVGLGLGLGGVYEDQVTLLTHTPTSTAILMVRLYVYNYHNHSLCF